MLKKSEEKLMMSINGVQSPTNGKAIKVINVLLFTRKMIEELINGLLHFYKVFKN